MKYRTHAIALCCIAAFSISSFALTNGPTQPEFSSFEPVDATDLVNLPTGDFSYPIPIGDVKTPDGTGYPLVLSYHAGIQSEQEATWVGLGWTLSAGAINRQVRMIPDDYNKTYGMLCHVYDKGDRGWSFEIGGGWGPIAATVGFSGKASGGIKCEGLSSLSVGYAFGGQASVGITLTNNLQNVSVGLSVGGAFNVGVSSQGVSVSSGFGAGSSSFGVGANMGMNMSFKGDVSMNGSAGVSINKVGGFSLSSQGGISVSMGGVGMSMAPGSSFNQKGVHQWASSSHFTIPLPYNFRLDLGFGNWGWYYENTSIEQSTGDLFNSEHVKEGIIIDNPIIANAQGPYDKWKYTTSEIPPSQLSESDLEISKGEYLENNGYNFPSQDVFSVSGQGMSGQFMSFRYSPFISCYSPREQVNGNVFKVDYLGTDNKPMGSIPLNPNDMFLTRKFSSGRTFKMIDETALNLVDQLESDYSYTGSDEYANIAPSPAGKRIIPLFGNDYSQLEGFVVTDLEGKTYYYTYPLYSYYQTTYVNGSPNLPDPKNEQTNSYRRMIQPYATAWLLTAVTGPDYIKIKTDFDARDDKMLPNQGDWGYWARFRYEYGLPVEENASTRMLKIKDSDIDAASGSPYFIPKSAYCWRMPFWDTKTTGELPHLSDECSNTKTYSSMFGVKDVTYLKSIETASEVAYFRTSERMDGYGIDNFPDLGNNVLSLENTAGLRIWDYLSEPGYTKLLENGSSASLQIAPDISLVTNDGAIDNINSNIPLLLPRCMIIHVPKNYSTQSFTGMRSGDLMLKMKFTRQNTQQLDKSFWYYMGWAWEQDYKLFNTETMFYIIKDQTGCAPSGGIPTRISSEFDKTLGFSDPALKNLIRSRRHRVETQEDIPIPIGKCIYVKDLGLSGVDLYVVAYNSGTTQHYYTEATFPAEYDAGGAGHWDPYHWWPAYFKSVELGNSYIPYVPPRNITKYVKKLDEIAWYSKAAFPFLTGIVNPEEAYIKNNWTSNQYTFPESYKRVKFRYNYELAKGTPNSVAKEQGRLTLKEVYVQGGPPSAPVDMPPYLFTYQGVSEQYHGYKDVDPWGFRKTVPGLNSNDKTQWDFSRDPRNLPSSSKEKLAPSPVGVNWNLSQIVLPSCGTMNVDYERDLAYSSWASVYQMQEENKCMRPWHEPVSTPERECYTGEKTVSYTPGDTIMTITSGTFAELEKGMLILVYYRGTDGANDYNEMNCMYRIIDIYSGGNQIVIDRPLVESTKFPSGMTLNYWIKGILKHQMFCDGIRVSKVQTKAFSGVYTTSYNYPEGGVVECIPAAAVSANFKDSAEHLEGTAFTNRFKRMVMSSSDFSNIDPSTLTPVVLTSKFIPVDETGFPYEFIGAQWIAYGKGTDGGANWVAGDFIELTWDNSASPIMNCDMYILFNKNSAECPATTRHIIINGVDLGPQSFGTPWYTPLPSGAATLKLSNVSLPVMSALKLKIVCTAADAADPAASGLGQQQLQIMGIHMRPHPNNTYYRFIRPTYSTGNTTVFYPVVEVKQTTPDTKTAINGLTRYLHYTFDDNVYINGSGVSTSLLHSNIINGTGPAATPIKIWKIYDRTGIVGLSKGMQQVELNPSDGTDKKIISYTEKQYAFSDELWSKGVYTVTSSSDHRGFDEPLGLIRERSIRVETSGQGKPLVYTTKNIADVIKYKPFLTNITNGTDKVVKKTKYGFFDAYTGSALATIFSGNAPTDSVKISVTIPYRFLPGVSQDKLDVLKEKNAYSLPGATFICDNGNSEVFPNTISALFPPYEAYTVIMRSATCNNYNVVNTIVDETKFPLNQKRLQLSDEYRCKTILPASFSWPTVSTADWICDRHIGMADGYSRPLCEIDAAGRKYALVHHPFMPTVVGKIDGGSEAPASLNNYCAVFTCDYDDFNVAYFDEKNDWKKGVCYATPAGVLKLSTTQTHFGNRSLHVINSQGPVKNVPITTKIIPPKGFVFSAWVYPNTGTTYIRFAIRPFDADKNPMATAIDLDKVATGLTPGKWQLIKFVIPKSEFDAIALSIYYSFLQISIGNNATEPGYPADSKPDFYVDDIRFYPAGSIVSSYYYDLNFALPITFVDANNKAQYVKYDQFGRAIEKGVIKEN